ncbi:MAG: ABC transporter ATP-binding protein [Alphaproteobacteria bacterium]|nr:ABC transporter ATP-binding protein [Alphaproteobacteria bacterium]
MIGAGELVVRSVSVSAGSVQILHGVDVALHPGEMCGIIGPSGAGKSTLIKVLLGLRRPQQGEVTLGGRPVRDAGPVGYVPQDDALHRSLSVQDTLDFAARLRLPALPEADRAARIDEVCRQVGLDERRAVRVGRLSGGQRKRVSVALELLTRPPLLILDEPTSGLDPGLEARMMGLFADVARAGNTVLVTTHAMQSLRRCDALMVLVAGHIAYFGPPEEAPAYFRADTFAGIFERLGLRKAPAWRKAWAESPERRQFMSRPAPVPQAPREPASREPASREPASREPASREPAPAAPAAAKAPTTPTPSASPAPPSPEEQLAALKEKLAQRSGP